MRVMQNCESRTLAKNVAKMMRIRAISRWPATLRPKSKLKLSAILQNASDPHGILYALAVQRAPSPWSRHDSQLTAGRFMSLVTELERLADALGDTSTETPPIAWSSVAERIARNLNVKTEEVGILGLSNKWRHLYFLFPEALKNVGFIPMSSTSALAARTVRESRPEINNNFSAVRHASVFEGVKAATVTGESIQKIVSAPILCDGKVVGVMQISRKGATPMEAGAD